MRVQSIREIEPEPSRCIVVDSEDKLYRVNNGEEGKGITTHNSVSQRNIVFGTIMRPESWYFLGVDLKRVELSSYRPYSNVVLKIATELEDAVNVLRFASQTMMKRYSLMEKLGKQNFLDLPSSDGVRSRALLLMVDELGSLLSPSGGKSLAASTPVRMADGSFKRIADVKVGDRILDPNYEAATVLDTYEPFNQKHLTVKVRKDGSESADAVVAGGEHLWTVYYLHPDGRRSGPDVVSTLEIQSFLKAQKELPENERIKVQMKRATKQGE